MLNPEISVIICTFNTKVVTLQCLDRLKKSIDFSKVPVETIVIENGTDGTSKTIKQEYPWVKLVEPGENTGFAKGNNLGLASSSKDTKYYLLLNSDVLVGPETLKQSIDFMSNTNCDVFGCRLNYGDGELQPSAGFFPKPFSVFTWILGIDLIPFLYKLFKPFHVRSKSFFGTTKQVDWVMGAYLFMKHNVVKKTNGFDENLFMYAEEVEWCKRIKDNGFTVWYTPDFSVTHLDQTSSKSDPEKIRKITQSEIKGVLYFIRKFYPANFNLTKQFIKLGLRFRILGFYVLGNNARKLAYKETLKGL